MLVLVTVSDCGMFFCPLNGMGKVGVGSIILRSAVAVSTVKRSMAVCWSTGSYSMILLGIC